MSRQIIIYWSNIFVPKNLSDIKEYDRIVQHLNLLMTGEYQSAGLKKKQFGKTVVWTTDLNDKKRLIFSAEKIVPDRPECLILRTHSRLFCRENEYSH